MEEITLYEVARDVYLEIPFYVKAGMLILTTGAGIAAKLISSIDKDIENYHKDLEDSLT